MAVDNNTGFRKRLDVAFGGLLLLIVTSLLVLHVFRSSSVLIGLTVTWLAALAMGWLKAHRMAGKIGEASRGLWDGSEQVSAAAAQLASASQSLAQGATAQTESVTEAAGTSELMASITRQGAESSRSASDLMGQSERFVAEVTEGLEGMVRAMRESDASADKISRITKVIDEIAFQTNILALNAAVEAARAAEAGAGFAVVADEVRNLASRCGQAAKDIAGLIEESTHKVKETDSRLDSVAKAMRSLIENDSKIKALVEEVTYASEELAKGTEQISTTMRRIQEMTEKTAASSQQTAATGQEMSAHAGSMQHMVRRLQTFGWFT